MCYHTKGHVTMAWINQLISIKHNLELFSCQCFKYTYILRNYTFPTIWWLYSFHLPASTMETSQYWPFTCEYSIWNTTVATLQLWTANLEPHILSNVIDCIYAAFFYGDCTQHMWSLPEKTLFSHFVTTLNDTFETELAHEDKGYESGNESFNILIPLSRAPRVYHVSTMEDLYFDPANCGQSSTTPEQQEENSPQRYRCCRSTCHSYRCAKQCRVLVYLYIWHFAQCLERKLLWNNSLWTKPFP